MIDYLEKRLKENFLMTLNELADALLSEFDVSVSSQSVKKVINGHGFTTKNVHQVSEHMNTAMGKK